MIINFLTNLGSSCRYSLIMLVVELGLRSCVNSSIIIASISHNFLTASLVTIGKLLRLGLLFRHLLIINAFLDLYLDLLLKYFSYRPGSMFNCMPVYILPVLLVKSLIRRLYHRLVLSNLYPTSDLIIRVSSLVTFLLCSQRRSALVILYCS
ncbi:hypothetical protein DFH28DRAFT_947941 [Melampsora americana]|nr:hypothetical protein DFH28DRAFT_947941 [Melampsora americana]